MSDSKDELRFGEMVGGSIFLLGIIVVGFRWWFGESLWNCIYLIFAMTMTAGLITLLSEGLHNGKLAMRGGYVYRDKNPTMYWVFVVFYSSLFFILLVGLLLYILLF